MGTLFVAASADYRYGTDDTMMLLLLLLTWPFSFRLLLVPAAVPPSDAGTGTG